MADTSVHSERPPLWAPIVSCDEWAALGRHPHVTLDDGLRVMLTELPPRVRRDTVRALIADVDLSVAHAINTALHQSLQRVARRPA
jgi:hypothetical protein